MLFQCHFTYQTYPDSGLCQISPNGDLLSSGHVRIAIPLKSGFQFLELLASKMRSLPPLSLLFDGSSVVSSFLLCPFSLSAMQNNAVFF